MTTWTPVRRTAMHYQHVERGAVMEDRDGWQQPVRFTSVDEEFQQLQTTGGLCDISPVGKLNLQGDELEPFLNAAFPGLGPLSVGSVRRLNLEHNPDVGPVVIARLADDEAWILTGINQAQSVADALGEQADQCAHVLDITSGLCGVSIAGPLAQRVLAGVSELDTDAEIFPNMTCAQTNAAEIHNMLLRIDFESLPGYQLYFGREFGEYMWDALLEAAEEYGITPVGIEAMARLRQGG